jgi:hypothetical protein
MKWLRAIGYSMFVSLQVFLSPLLFQWYKNKLGLGKDEVIGVAMFFAVLILVELAVLIFFYVSAIQNKDLKDVELF